MTSCLHGCHSNIHSTPVQSRNNPTGEWQKHTENAKKKINDWLKMKTSEGTFRQQTFRPPDPEGEKPPSSNGLPEAFLNLFPTTARFNSYFDRAFARLPSGMDMIRKTPTNFHPYLLLSRADKPIGSWLLFLPSAWGICMASQTFHIPDIPLLLLFGTGEQQLLYAIVISIQTKI